MIQYGHYVGGKHFADQRCVGRNGLLHVLPDERGSDGPLLSATGVYNFGARKTNNLLADQFIKDHGDVKNPEVANAVLAQVILSL